MSKIPEERPEDPATSPSLAEAGPGTDPGSTTGAFASTHFPPLPRLFFYAERLFSELRFACHEDCDDASPETGSSPVPRARGGHSRRLGVPHAAPETCCPSVSVGSFRSPRSPLSAPPCSPLDPVEEQVRCDLPEPVCYQLGQH